MKNLIDPEGPGLPNAPEDLCNDWIAFTTLARPIVELADWIQIKAAEYEWNVFDLAAVLICRVTKPPVANDITPKGEVR